MLEAVGVNTNMILVHSDVEGDGKDKNKNKGKVHKEDGEEEEEEEREEDDRVCGSEKVVDLSADDSDLFIGSRLLGASKSVYEKNLSLIRIHAGESPSGAPAQAGDNDDAEGRGALEERSYFSQSQFQPSVYGDSADHHVEGVSRSTPPLDAHYNLSATIFGEIAHLLPLAICGLLKYAVVCQTDSSKQSIAGIATIDHTTLSVGLVLITYNRTLHIVKPSYIADSFAADNVASEDDDEDESEGDGGSPSPSYDFSSIDVRDIILSAHLKNVHVSPVFIPMDGFRDAFEVVFPFTASSSPSVKAESSSAAPRSASSVVFVAQSALHVRNWMRKISNPFVDPNFDPPTDIHQNADFAQASAEMSNGSSLLVVGDYVDGEEEGEEGKGGVGSEDGDGEEGEGESGPFPHPVTGNIEI